MNQIATDREVFLNMAKIHPSSIVAEGAVVDDSVEIGPFCYVGPNVRIGAGCRLIGHCNIDGHTTLGERNVISPFASLGQPAQDHAVEPGAVTYLEIGSDNIVREGCTIHTGTKPNSATRIGNHNMFMNATHVAHNCQVGNNVIYVGFAGTAGYCEVYDNALISGLVGIHQFCRVGRFAIISGGSVFSKDVPPFMMAEGRNGGVKMINKIGLQRAGFSEETITVIKHIFRLYYRSGLIPSKALEKIRTELPQIPEVLEFVNFCETSKRGVIAAHGEGGHRN